MASFIYQAPVWIPMLSKLLISRYGWKVSCPEDRIEARLIKPDVSAVHDASLPQVSLATPRPDTAFAGTIHAPRPSDISGSCSLAACGWKESFGARYA